MYTIIQIIISIVVIYLIFSTVVNIIVETISSFLKLRGKMLMKAVLHLFDTDPIANDIYNHPRIKSLKTPDNQPPSYIPASSIAAALIDLIASKGRSATPNNVYVYDDFIKGVATLKDGYLKTLLNSFVDATKDAESLGLAIEKWFNDSMDRVSGWYKRKTYTMIVIVSIIVTIGCNVDTIYVIRSAQADPVLRQRLNDLGDQLIADSVFVKAGIPTHDADYYEEYVNDESVTSSDTVLQQVQNQPAPGTSFDDRLSQLKYMSKLVAESDLPIGWTNKTETNWLYKILGWILTVFAISAGAPFWFDILKKLANIRGTGPKPSTTKNSD